MKEKTQTKKLQALFTAAGGKVIKVGAGPYIETGTPDLIGCLRGKCVVVEMKRPGEKPTPLQLYRLKQWGDAGAAALWGTDADEIMWRVAPPAPRR